MGHQREALRLLVDEARDVTQTIELVERANNESLWSELIERITLHDEGSPVSPDFVGGMLQQVGGRLKEPHKLVEAIPSDMEVRACMRVGREEAAPPSFSTHTHTLTHTHTHTHPPSLSLLSFSRGPFFSSPFFLSIFLSFPVTTTTTPRTRYCRSLICKRSWAKS